MTDQIGQIYLDQREQDPELAEIEARIQAAREEGEREALPQVPNDHLAGDMDEHAGEHEDEDGHFGHGEETLEPGTPLWLQLWRAVNDPRRLVPSAAIGMYDAVSNFVATVVDTADVVEQAGTVPAVPGGLGVPGLTEFMREGPAPGTARQRFKNALPGLFDASDHLRESLDQMIPGGSKSGDIMLQKTIQFGLPFAGTLKLMNMGKGGALVKTGKVVAADFLVNSTVWDPHEARFGELLREFESQMPEEHWAKGFSSSAVNLMAPYIDYISHTDDEGEWEGRWRNAVDSAGMNAVLAPIFIGGGIALKGLARASAGAGRASHTMREWLSGEAMYGREPTFTIEIASSRSEIGQQIGQALDLAGRAGDEQFAREVIGAQVEGMQVAVEAGTFDKLLHAITGRHPYAARSVEVPSAGSPFDFAGTFEGGLSPNVRVRAVGLTEDEVRRMNAVIGDAWDQDAMAATEIRVDGVSWASKPHEGYTRGASIFVAGTEVDPRAVALRVRGAVPVEHEFSIRRVAAGYSIDIFPRFTEAGPVGLTREQALAIGESIETPKLQAEVYPHDYRSTYTQRDEYRVILEQVDGQVDRGIGGGEAGAGGAGERDLLAEARADLQRAREAYEGRITEAIRALEGRLNQSGPPRRTGPRRKAEEHGQHPVDPRIANDPFTRANHPTAQDLADRILARPGEREAVEAITRANRERILGSPEASDKARELADHVLRHPGEVDAVKAILEDGSRMMGEGSGAFHPHAAGEAAAKARIEAVAGKEPRAMESVLLPRKGREPKK